MLQQCNTVSREMTFSSPGEIPDLFMIQVPVFCQFARAFISSTCVIFCEGDEALTLSLRASLCECRRYCSTATRSRSGTSNLGLFRRQAHTPTVQQHRTHFFCRLDSSLINVFAGLSSLVAQTAGRYLSFKNQVDERPTNQFLELHIWRGKGCYASS
jgi:hypothetical protein